MGIAPSIDQGQSFYLSHVLYYQPKRNLGQARLAMPSQLDDFMLVVRQIELDKDEQSLVGFSAELP